jgi:hypothetical protein
VWWKVTVADEVKYCMKRCLRLSNVSEEFTIRSFKFVITRQNKGSFFHSLLRQCKANNDRAR